MKKHIIFLVLTNGIVSMGLAQNYDADSVYYTPIPKPTHGRSSDDEQKNPVIVQTEYSDYQASDVDKVKVAG